MSLYIAERLRSVFDQDYPLRQVVVLDDALARWQRRRDQENGGAAGRDIELIINEKNSGSPFRSGRKGVELAKGDYVWIAEADDVADRPSCRVLSNRCNWRAA